MDELLYVYNQSDRSDSQGTKPAVSALEDLHFRLLVCICNTDHSFLLHNQKFSLGTIYDDITIKFRKNKFSTGTEDNLSINTLICLTFE